jgi:hypothetical protein
MDGANNGHANQPLSLKQIREQKRLVRAQLELHQLKAAERALRSAKVVEAAWGAWWLNDYGSSD